MEETLGKRIMRHRKALGLTQDQLAEQLGVTAQAVSKWENDQSCPDITILPKLARIFGTTTDHLLGSVPEEPPVFAAEVVEEPEPEGIHVEKDGWEFHYDSGRRESLRFALLVLAVGAQLLCARIWNVDIGFWQILWPTTLICYGLGGFFGSFSFLKISSLLLGSWFLADYWQLLPFQFGSDLVFPALVIVFGLGLLFDALKKPWKPKFHFHHNSSKATNDYNTSGECFNYTTSFSESCQQVVMPRLRSGKVSCSFGEYTVDLSEVEEIAQDCTLDASCSFGELTILVPRRYAVRQHNSTFFASFEITGHPDPEPVGIIDLKASISFGEIEIKYI